MHLLIFQVENESTQQVEYHTIEFAFLMDGILQSFSQSGAEIGFEIREYYLFVYAMHFPMIASRKDGSKTPTEEEGRSHRCAFLSDLLDSIRFSAPFRHCLLIFCS